MIADPKIWVLTSRTGKLVMGKDFFHVDIFLESSVHKVKLGGIHDIPGAKAVVEARLEGDE